MCRNVVISSFAFLFSTLLVSGNPAPPSYGHHIAPAYGSGYGGGYQQTASYGNSYNNQPHLKHNCSLQDETEIVEVCTPSIVEECGQQSLPIKILTDGEYCYTSSKTVCTESIQKIDNEVCTYTYQSKSEDTVAKNVEVTFEKKTDVQVVTVCQAGYGGYGSGHHHSTSPYQSAPQHCQQIDQETAYNVPIVTPIDVPVTVKYPEPVKTCENKPIDLPVITCEVVSEERCVVVPQVEDSSISVEKCISKIGEPACQTLELTLPKQVCVELVYGYAHDVGHPAAEASGKESRT